MRWMSSASICTPKPTSDQEKVNTYHQIFNYFIAQEMTKGKYSKIGEMSILNYTRGTPAGMAPRSQMFRSSPNQPPDEIGVDTNLTCEGALSQHSHGKIVESCTLGPVIKMK